MWRYVATLLFCAHVPLSFSGEVNPTRPPNAAASLRDSNAAPPPEVPQQQRQRPVKGIEDGAQKVPQESHAGTNCIKIVLPGKLILRKRKGLGKSYSLENSLQESIFREDLFLYNCHAALIVIRRVLGVLFSRGGQFQLCKGWFTLGAEIWNTI